MHVGAGWQHRLEVARLAVRGDDGLIRGWLGGCFGRAFRWWPSWWSSACSLFFLCAVGGTSSAPICVRGYPAGHVTGSPLPSRGPSTTPPGACRTSMLGSPEPAAGDTARSTYGQRSRYVAPGASKYAAAPVAATSTAEPPRQAASRSRGQSLNRSIGAQRRSARKSARGRSARKLDRRGWSASSA